MRLLFDEINKRKCNRVNTCEPKLKRKEGEEL